MEASEDSTAVLQMKRDFDAFFTHGSSRKEENKKAKLSFDQASFLDQTPSQSQSVSMQKILEKDREQKLRQAELIKAKAYITQLESQILTLKRNYQQSMIEQEKTLEDVKMQQQRELDKCLSVKQQLHMLVNKEEEARDELKELRREHGVAKSNYEQKIMGLTREKLKLENQLQELQHTSHNKIFELKNEKMRHDLELQICQSELEETKLQLQNSLKRSSDLKQQMEELEEFRLKSLHAEHKIKDLELTISGMEDDAVITKTMRSQLTRMPEIERNNRMLREENQYCKNTQENTLLLKEKLVGLKEKLERSKKKKVPTATLR